MSLVGLIGYGGFGMDWHVPGFQDAVSQHTWISSPWLRIPSTLRFLINLPYFIDVENQYTAKRRDLGLQSPVQNHEIWNKRLFFTHSMFGVTPARAMPPNVVVLGPLISPKKVHKLDPIVEKTLSSWRDKGLSVVYISYGSVVQSQSSITNRTLSAIQIALEKNDEIAFLWSTTQSNVTSPDLPSHLQDRLLIRQWVNQKAVLNHPAVKLFFTHGGISSILESIYFGKPMLILPFFGDQYMNAIQVSEIGLGEKISKGSFTAEQLVSRFESLIKDAASDPSSTQTLAGRVAQFKKIARLNSPAHRLLAANMLEMAASSSIEHLVPASVYLSWAETHWMAIMMTLLLVIGSTGWTLIRKEYLFK